MSLIYYKARVGILEHKINRALKQFANSQFKSAKDFDTCPVDGSGMSVFELKREIMIGKKLGKGLDFDLALYNAQARPMKVRGWPLTAEYDDDTTVIPRNTSVLVARKPAQAKSAKNASRYLTAAAPIMPKALPKAAIYTKPALGSSYRCGERGHYINVCPTLGDPNFENKPKIKKATGIPTIFLKTIKNKDAVDKGLMVTGEGDLVVAMPNEYGPASHSSDQWKKFTQNATTFKSLDDIYDATPLAPHLACFLCKKILRDAVKSRCCSTAFCDDHIRTHLLENGLKCPKCQARLKPDELVIDQELRREVDAFLRGGSGRSSRPTNS
ncbi:hypothetical protein HDU91_006863, partial [Kappamyces sp. JEL0680]